MSTGIDYDDFQPQTAFISPRLVARASCATITPRR